MNMAKAIALSAGNKAKTRSDTGHIIVVQERYTGVDHTWLHVWIIRHAEVYETDIPLPHPVKLKTGYDVDPDAEYWTSI